jgi:gas vesicle protein
MKKALYLILAGVAIGILLAPDKGTETWKKLKQNFDDWKDDATDRVNDIVSQGKDLLGKGKQAVNIAASEAQGTANNW